MRTKKGNKKVTCTILAAAIACTTAFVSVPFTAMAQDELTVQDSAVADVALDDTLTVHPMLQMVASAETSDQDEQTEDVWENRLMADVDDSLNVREKASKNSDVVGYLYKGSKATVIEKGEKWTLIKSGNVKGYVLNKYCVFGDDAKALALKVCKKTATVKTDILRVREKASESAEILGIVGKGDQLKVSVKAKSVDGWTAVKYNGKTAYVSSEYVKVKRNYTKALTVKEAQEKLAAEQAAAAEAASASTVTSDSSKITTTQGSSVSASASEEEILGALIYIEAGDYSYQGELAVGAVVMNRVKSSSYPNSVKGVIYQSGQFATGRISSIIKSGVPSTCMKAARAALSGQDNTGGKKNFRDASTGHSGKKIGDNIFF